MVAERPVLVQAVARVAVVVEPADRVHHAPHTGRVLRPGQVVADALDDQVRSLIHAVLPVLLQAVAGADHQVHRQQQRRLHVERLAARRREADPRAHHVPAALGVGRRVRRPAQVLAGPVRPDPHRFLQQPAPGSVLLDDAQDRVIGEPHRRVEPVERAGVPRLDARRLGLPDWADAPGPVPDPPPPVRRHVERLAVHRDRPGPLPGLRHPLGVEHDPLLRADEVLRLDLRRDRPLPGEVERQPELVRAEHHAEPLEALENLDAERPDLGVHPVRPQFAGGAHHPVRRSAAQQRERVGHPQVRVLAQAHDQHRVPGQRERVEVVPVVEVAVRRPDVPHHLGNLVHGIVVKRRQRHDGSPSRITSSRREALLL